MLDIHTHILPQMDDGSRSVEESLLMLRSLRAQGVDTVALTSHFYAEDESPERFLARRAQARSRLEAAMDDGEWPSLRSGAEVCYYIGVSRTEGIERLCIEDTPLLMLEMPMTHWDRSVMDEALELATDGRVILLLAHIDRYLRYNKLDAFELLRSRGALMQINAGFAEDRGNHRLLRKLAKRDLIQFVGTDCHGITHRAPHMSPALEMLEKYGGERLLRTLDLYEEEFFD
ncbi:MAG: hypothetical protein IJS22_01145 [Lachnospiraceae bacterium]|nr:hypothetical protein [Lachnospiraceae bacterium]